MIILEETNNVNYFDRVSKEKLTDVFEYIESFLQEVAFLQKQSDVDITEIREKNESKETFERRIYNKMTDRESFIYGRLVLQSNIRVYYNYDMDNFTVYKDFNTTESVKLNIDINGNNKISKIVREIVSEYPINKKGLDSLFDLVEIFLKKSFKSKFSKDTKAILSESNYNKLYLKLKKDQSLVNTLGKYGSVKVAINSIFEMSIKASVIERFNFASKLISELELSDSQVFELIAFNYQVNIYLQEDYTLRNLYINFFERYKNQKQLENCLQTTAKDFTRYFDEGIDIQRYSTDLEKAVYCFLSFNIYHQYLIEEFTDSIINIYDDKYKYTLTDDMFMELKIPLLRSIQDNNKNDYERSVFLKINKKLTEYKLAKDDH